MSKFKVQMNFSYGWDDVFTTDGKPTIFKSKKEAEESIQENIQDIKEAIADGNMSMDSMQNREDFRIIKMDHKNKFSVKASQLPQGLHTPQETNEMIKSLEKLKIKILKVSARRGEDKLPYEGDIIHLKGVEIWMPYKENKFSVKYFCEEFTFNTHQEVIEHLTIQKVKEEQVILSEWRIATSKAQNFAQHLIKARDILNKGIESMEKLDLSFLSKESQVERNNVIKENVEYKKAIEKILNKIK